MNLALTIPLDGRQLIEAAAGTGKTHTIKTLFARLVVEKGIPVDRILAVTYTEAAAKELKDRIRAALEELTLAAPPDPTLAQLRLLREANPTLFDRRVHCALRDFDEALIGTIHGFAARMLAEFAFESGRSFEQELAADNRAAIRECVLDYCRHHLYGAPRRELELLEAAGVTIARLQSAIAAIFSVPGAEIAESAPPPAPERLRAAAEKLLPLWQAGGPAILAAIAESKLLSHAQKAYHPRRIAAIRNALDDFAGTGVFDGSTAAAIRALSTSELAAAITDANRKKNLSYPPHPLFEYAEEFVRELDKLRLGVLLEVRNFVAERLRQLRERDNFGSFNDLLTDLAELAAGNTGAAKLLRERFDAALIDEFQDTDPVQFEIFSSLFADPARPLLLVGDPKQAIYSFRGADIFTYDRARRETANRLALDTNFRSEARLIEAVNQVFSRPGQPVFGCDFVSYGEAIKPGGRPESEDRVLRYRGETDLQPLKILFLADSGSGGGNRADRSGVAERIAVKLAARLLTDPDFTLGGRPVRPSDLAMLVNTNPEGRRLKRALAAAGIPAIPRKNGSVYAGPEARDFLTLVKAMIDYDSPRSVRAAMALECFGFDFSRLTDDDAVSDAEALFREANLGWRESGFITAFAVLAAKAGFREKLVSLADGERKVTNFFQLAELLHQRCGDRIAEFSELENFFSEQAGREDDESAELRLESDADAVTIVTIHKSKGLQYPIVLIPFFSCAQIKVKKDGKPKIFHRDGIERPLLSLAPDAGVLAAVSEELFAEKLRLLYVALTRAINACYLIQLPASELNAVDYLFGDPRLVAPRADSAVARCEVDDPGGQEPIELERPQVELELRQPELRVLRSHGTLSFTGLTAIRDRDQDEETAAADEPPEVAAPDGPPADSPLLAFPGGANTGECFHRIFEELDFADAGKEPCRRIVEAALANYRLAGNDEHEKIERIELLNRLAAETVAAPLLPDLKLSGIPRRDTLREMRFLYAIPERTLSPGQLRELLATYGYSLDDGYQGEIRGGFFMTGAIDLVFRRGERYYLADWKSNRIDGRIASFQPEGLAGEMRRHSYDLQYLIYCVALRRHLMRTAPGFDWRKNFGGVFYLFLRGITPDDPVSGIYRDLEVPEELIVELDGLTGELR
ncbi:MAG: UvrD-helicase domain-containing protein [Victivallaceae bacterium]